MLYYFFSHQKALKCNSRNNNFRSCRFIIRFLLSRLGSAQLLNVFEGISFVNDSLEIRKVHHVFVSPKHFGVTELFNIFLSVAFEFCCSYILRDRWS